MVSVAGAAAFHASGTSNRYLGSITNVALNRPIVGIASTPTGNGYWLAAADGGVFTFGDAHFYGSTGSHRLIGAHRRHRLDADGRRATGSSRSDGGVFTFGDAQFLRVDRRHRLTAPIVGIAATPSGNGYWLVAADGGIFTFGDAKFVRLDRRAQRSTAPIVGIAATRSGNGYWLAGRNGGLHVRRRALQGIGPGPIAVGADRRASPVRTAATATGSSRRRHHSFRSAARTRSPPTSPLAASMDGNGVVAIAASPKGGYWVAAETGNRRRLDNAGGREAVAQDPGLIAFQLRGADERRTQRAAHGSVLVGSSARGPRDQLGADACSRTNEFQHQNLGAHRQPRPTAASKRSARTSSAEPASAADAGTAHLALMSSAEHRANMLLPQGQLVGIGARVRRRQAHRRRGLRDQDGRAAPAARVRPIPPTQPDRRDQPRRRALLSRPRRSTTLTRS